MCPLIAISFCETFRYYQQNLQCVNPYSVQVGQIYMKFALILQSRDVPMFTLTEFSGVRYIECAGLYMYQRSTEELWMLVSHISNQLQGA